MNVQGMYRVVCRVQFEQTPNKDFPSRTRSFLYKFLSEFEASDSWQSLTNTCKITIPKNVWVRDQNNRLVSLSGTNVNIGGFGPNAPLFMRGDKISLSVGYRYYDAQGNEKLTMSEVFSGYIRNVGSKKPITLECEDNMYALKQILAPNKTYASGTELETIMQDMLAGSGFTVNVLTNTTVGEFRTHNETVAQILARLNKEYHFYAYFRGTELRIGSIVYVEQDAIDAGKKVFKFQHNIISDALEYNRIEDIELSAVAYSINKIELSGTTKAGRRKKGHRRLEVLVTLRNGKITSYARGENDKKAEIAPNVQGERRTLYFWNVQTNEKLIELAAAELKKYYYRGLTGKFITFGLPYIKQGDNVDILDSILPERNGRYKVRSVRHFGGAQIGLRQEIELEYLITQLDDKGNAITNGS